MAGNISSSEFGDAHHPPQNLIAERSALGSLLLDCHAIDEVADILRPEQFYRDVHSTIYVAMQKLHENGFKADAVTVAEELDKRFQLEDIGGIPYLVEILDTVPDAADVKHYAEIVRDTWIQRRLTDE